MFDHHGVLPFIGPAAPSRPSWRRKAADGPDLHGKAKRAAEAKRRMAKAGSLLRDAKAGSPAGGKEPGAAIAGTGRLPQGSLSQKAVAAALFGQM
jgi:hypothetical protein